jgi:regulator of protease activity HflC (stomatin/prohibitin superfamily)
MIKKISLLGSIMLLAVGCGITNVDPGNVGVEVDRCSGGGVSNKILPIGYHFTGPCTDIYEYSVSMQNAAWSGEQQIHVSSSEGLDIRVDVSLNYTIQANVVPHIYEKFRKDLEGIENSYMRNLVREAMRREFSKFPADQLYTKQYDIQTIVEKAAREDFAKDGFQVENLAITKMEVPETVKNSIEAKVNATQNAQRTENEIKTSEAAGKKAVATTEAEGKAILAKARAEAEAKRLKADADAYYISKVSAALSSQYIEYAKNVRWDGKLPQVTSGTNLLDLRK